MADDIAIQGFLAGAVAANIRYKNRLDLAMIHGTVPTAAAGVFTSNTVKAAPVVLGMERIRSGRCQTILVNSGMANACTGDAGMAAARTISSLVASRLGIAEDLVQVASTGVIGEQLPVARFEEAMGELTASLSPNGLGEVAKAIMTTDTVSKTAARTVTLGGIPVAIAGIAKGSGMIMPRMATMLSFILTDAAVFPALLQRMLTRGVASSFNAITVDGDTSTNDTALLLANGMAGNSIIVEDKAAGPFQEALDDLLRDLALQIVRDGEGATKCIAIMVKGAASAEDAEKAARTIANSCLVKTAFFGEDANWGRIMAALGRSGAAFHVERVDIAFDQAPIVRGGIALGKQAEKEAAAILKKKTFTVEVHLHAGSGSHTMHTCDLSIDYVKINADYRS